MRGSRVAVADNVGLVGESLVSASPHPSISIISSSYPKFSIFVGPVLQIDRHLGSKDFQVLLLPCPVRVSTEKNRGNEQREHARFFFPWKEAACGSFQNKAEVMCFAAEAGDKMRRGANYVRCQYTPSGLFSFSLEGF